MRCEGKRKGSNREVKKGRESQAYNQTRCEEGEGDREEIKGGVREEEERGREIGELYLDR